jgi:hypothetical protein
VMFLLLLLMLSWEIIKAMIDLLLVLPSSAILSSYDVFLISVPSSSIAPKPWCSSSLCYLVAQLF